MNILTKLHLLVHVLKWRLTWGKHDCSYAYTIPGNPKFMGSLDAVRTLIPDKAVLAFSGLAGNQRAAIMYWAIREMFEKTGHPRELTLTCTGGLGGRGIVPGSMEELALDGLAVRLICGHQETFKALLKQADKGKLELQCMPQGIVALLFDALGRGESSLLTDTGAGTFVDPRTGRGTPVLDPKAEQLVAVEGDKLRYRIPSIDVAVFGAPAADREGNIYVKNASLFAETREIARAAKANNGKVIANVGLIVDKGYDEIFLPADMIDAVVYDPNTEQTASVKHSKCWKFLTLDSDLSVDEAIERLRFMSQILGITPRRTEVDNVLARLAAQVFTSNARKGIYVNIGVGLPEEVCRLMYEGGLFEDITLLTESGVLGGLPAPGMFFGAEACPTRIISSAEVFKLCYEKLDVAILGALQVDSDGNVNVSKRGEGAINYVGPGGFIDLATSAKMVVFVTSWMAHGETKIQDGRISIMRPGKPKFVDKVDEITFSGKHALALGKRVFYVTNVGVFRLTERGMELMQVMPGVDIQRDILDWAPMKVVLPEQGEIPVVESSIITGQGFKLALG